MSRLAQYIAGHRSLIMAKYVDYGSHGELYDMAHMGIAQSHGYSAIWHRSQIMAKYVDHKTWLKWSNMAPMAQYMAHESDNG